jgi:hypothetical protein
MSLILNSNIISVNNLGSYKSFISDAYEEYAKYKARVTGDGGEILNENETINMFKQLIALGIYGLARTFVGGSYGVKRTNTGAIQKIYALDGEDLVAYNLSGGGVEHKISNNEIIFNNSIVSNDGGNIGTAFITESKIKTKGMGLVIGIKGSDLSKKQYEQVVTAFTQLEKINNSSPLFLVYLGQNPVEQIIGRRQSGPLPNQNDASSVIYADASLGTYGSNYVFYADTTNQQFKGYRGGELVTFPTVPNKFSNLDNFEGYITLGAGLYRDNGIQKSKLFQGKISQFFIYDTLPDSKVELLAKL